MKQFEQCFVESTASLKEVMRVIEASSAHVALIMEGGGLRGVITDGDIRRSMLNGIEFNAPVSSILKDHFVSLPQGTTRQKALAILKQKNLRHLPILDSTGRPVDLVTINDFFSFGDPPVGVVLMAGGKGSRLGHLTANCPKPMLHVADKPIIESIVEHCSNHGLTEFFISVNYHKDQIIDYFGDGSRWGVDISYLQETSPLGTAGSLSLVPKGYDKPLLVINADVLTTANLNQLVRFHADEMFSATLVVRNCSITVPYGVVETRGNLLSRIVEKPVISNFVSAGVYVIEPEVRLLVPEDQFFDMPELFSIAVAQGKKVGVFPIAEYWIDVGLPENFEVAKKDWESRSRGA